MGPSLLLPPPVYVYMCFQVGHFTAIMYESRRDMWHTENSQNAQKSGGRERAAQYEICGSTSRIVRHLRGHRLFVYWWPDYCARIAPTLPPCPTFNWSTTFDEFALLPLGELGCERNLLLSTLVRTVPFLYSFTPFVAEAPHHILLYVVGRCTKGVVELTYE